MIDVLEFEQALVDDECDDVGSNRRRLFPDECELQSPMKGGVDYRPPSTCNTLEEFIAYVMYDGRYISDFTTDPHKVASALKLEVLEDILDGIQGCSSLTLLNHSAQKMKERMAETALEQQSDIVAGAPLIVVGIVVVIVLDRSAEPACQAGYGVEDMSVNAGSKI